MTREELVYQIFSKNSYLCTGLDTEMGKLPIHLPKNGDAMVEFNRQIINATLPYSVSYKINTAFYEQYGARGWEWMEQTLDYLPKSVFRIADAKRGDIGNTSTMYARAFFEALSFDAVTVAPYMGKDSLRPFLEFKDKWIICLALTSNPGHADFQMQGYEGKKLYERVIETVCKWGNPDNLMFVVGATRADYVAEIRKTIPEHFLLVPGVGAQGGSLSDISRAGLNKDAGLLVNSSRGILYASSGEDFAEAAAEEARKLQTVMAQHLADIKH
ncbi:MAG: orotidine-5'-phosphate decarboxylase [Sphingomonadales bacterium]|nr:orotidine-5'-phosphate decarboxylase [Sphingomonadales bacterium]